MFARVIATTGVSDSGETVPLRINALARAMLTTLGRTRSSTVCISTSGSVLSSAPSSIFSSGPPLRCAASTGCSRSAWIQRPASASRSRRSVARALRATWSAGVEATDTFMSARLDALAASRTRAWCVLTRSTHCASRMRCRVGAAWFAPPGSSAVRFMLRMTAAASSATPPPLRIRSAAIVALPVGMP